MRMAGMATDPVWLMDVLNSCATSFARGSLCTTCWLPCGTLSQSPWLVKQKMQAGQRVMQAANSRGRERDF